MMTAIAPPFLEIFRGRRDGYRALLELSHRQQTLIEADDYTELLAVLGRKQVLLSRLEDVNRRYPDLREQWQASRSALPAEHRSTCEHLLAETEHCLAELLLVEQSSTESLTTRRDATQHELQAIARGSQAHEAYRDHLAPVTHRHLDIGQ